MYKFIKMYSELGMFFFEDYIFQVFRNFYCSYRKDFFLVEIFIYKGEKRVNWWKVCFLILFKNVSRKFIMYVFKKNESIYIFN